MNTMEYLKGERVEYWVNAGRLRDMNQSGWMMKSCYGNSVTSLASRYGRYGYKRITALLNQEGWKVNHKRVFRIWREEGLKVPAKQPKKCQIVAR